ncbi:HAD-IA family hydrolase [Jeotgalibaca arthritidis]|uniref:HAD-IA family hydrolase n=1 Tax=Jeotgalibaca arthritidis TaxID=1868794 RepID=A0A6G7KCX1_9LACT|nr:HAD-IA family hydrolase [Jeotgalibaca arthritidis]QII83087.1 HAD-IA family hydrolase [Jeotgalibaca arthritidis]
MASDCSSGTDLLAYLKEQSFLLAIVTGKARRSLDISLEQLEMADLFDYIITGDDVEKAKPHPEGIFKVLDNLKLKKEDVIFVGDSDADIAAGLDAGVHTVGVQWLKNYQTLDFSYEPHHYFDDARLFKAYVADYFKEETK